MIKWVKPNGNTIETSDSDATIEYAVSLGWKQDNGKRRGRPPGRKNKIATEEQFHEVPEDDPQTESVSALEININEV